MQLTVNFSYVEQIVPPRCRNPRRVRFNDGVEVLTLREVEPMAAPIAIISSQTNVSPELDTGPIEYRWFEGKLWTDCKVYGCTRQGHTARGSDYEFTHPGSEVSLITESVTMSRHDLGIFVSVSEGKSAIGDYLHRWALELILIEGRVFRPAGEPRYVVMTFGLSNNHGGTALLCTDLSNPNIKEEAYFSLLQLEKAHQYAGRIAAGRGDTRSFSLDPGFTFRILIPEAIQVRNNFEQQVAA